MSSSHVSNDNSPDSSDFVTLIDEQERSLDCFIENSLEVDDSTYILLLPIDSPVIILAWDDEDDSDFPEAVLIEETREIEELFSDAKAVLAELNLTLKHTAFTLTVRGELPPFDTEELLTLKLDEDINDQNLDTEELQFLASFYHLEQKYSIYTPITPLLFLAKFDENDHLEIISPEDKYMRSILEELLFNNPE